MDSQAHVGPTESTEGQVLTITVSDPKKESEGMNSYVSYKVNTATNREEFSYGQFGVIRRYSDFAWLSDRLARDVPGAIGPPLPPSTPPPRARCSSNCRRWIALTSPRPRVKRRPSCAV